MYISIRFIIIIAFFHALILIGFGHAGGVVGMTVLFAPNFLANPNLIDLLLIKADRLPAIGTLSLMGYFILICACLAHGRSRNILYLISTLVLWWSVAYLVITKDAWEMVYSYPVFYVPYLIISLVPLFWNRLSSKASSWFSN